MQYFDILFFPKLLVNAIKDWPNVALIRQLYYWFLFISLDTWWHIVSDKRTFESVLNNIYIISDKRLSSSYAVCAEWWVIPVISRILAQTFKMSEVELYEKPCLSVCVSCADSHDDWVTVADVNGSSCWQPSSTSTLQTGISTATIVNDNSDG